MSDRNLLEVERAFKQTLQSFAQRLKRLELRAWNGAVRSTQLAEFTTMSSVPQTVLNLPLTSGRWIIHQRGVCAISTTVAGAAVAMRSRTPDELIAMTQFSAGWNVGNSVLPFSDFGEVILSDVTTVSLEVFGSGWDTAVWTGLSLLAVPV